MIKREGTESLIKRAGFRAFHLLFITRQQVLATLINVRIIESLLVFCKFVTSVINKSLYHGKES